MRHYYAIAERGDGPTWWITFPGVAGFSAADDAGDIPAQAQDFLETVLMVPAGKLPRSIEDGATPPTAADLADFEQPTIVVVIPFVHAEAAKAAA